MACSLLFPLLPLAGQEMARPETPLRLGTNENPFGSSAAARRAVVANVDRTHYYNRDENEAMVRKLAEKEGVPESYILPTPGSGPVLEMTALAYAAPGKNIVTAMPGYPQLTGAFTRYGGEVKYVPVGPDRGYDFEAMLEAIDANTAIVYICNPNNPTGVLADPVALKTFIMKVPPRVLVFVDEAYLELADTGLAANTVAPLTRMRPMLIVSRTFSKAHGLAGMRAGYGIGSPTALDPARKYDFARGPNYLTAIAVQAAIEDKEFIEYSASNYRRVRARTAAAFESMGIPYIHSDAAFILFDCGMNAVDFRERMAEEGIMVQVTFGPAPGYENWSRVSIGTDDDMDYFLAALKKIRAEHLKLAAR
jgi:histidinol-phosphate aminotransferase